MLATARKKIVEIEGATFLIGSLTMSYVEEFVKWRPKGKTQQQMVDRAYSLVIESFNNAGFLDDSEWTQEKVNKVVDLECFDQLQTEILNFNRLKPVDQGATTGESQAA